MKTCFKCGEKKELSEFYKHPQMKDGHVNKCKECNKKDVHKNYSDNIERIIEYERKRFQTPKRKAQMKANYEKRKLNNKIRYMANYLSVNAVRDKRLTKQPCEICSSKETEMHHDDYHKPLEVRWLCRKHHLELHGKKDYSHLRKSNFDLFL